MGGPADGCRILTPDEYAEYLKAPSDFVRQHRGQLTLEPSDDGDPNPYYWCEVCRSFHPDTAVCVDRTWKACKVG